MLVVFCHWSDGSKCVPFVEPNTREASVAFFVSSNNVVFVVLAFSSDDIGGSYTSCVVTKDLCRRAKMAMMSTSILAANEELAQAPGSSMVFSTAEKYGVAYVGDHVRDPSHIGKRKYTWSMCLTAA